jgi:hypothetical protein
VHSHRWLCAQILSSFSTVCVLMDGGDLLFVYRSL